MQPLELVTRFIAPLNQGGFPYFVTGSIASILYGEPRLTHDIDIVIHLKKSDIENFINLFPEQEYYSPPIEVIHIELARTPFAHLNLIHHASGLKADLYPYVGDSLHEWAFKNKRKVDLSEKLHLWVAPPEYVILRKLEYFREGGSQKHLVDIQKMLELSSDSIDHSFLNQKIASRHLETYWAQVKNTNPK